MLTLKTSKHIRTNRNTKSFRSCEHATGESLAHVDRARLAREEERLAAREERVLPPSARAQQTKES